MPSCGSDRRLEGKARASPAAHAPRASVPAQGPATPTSFREQCYLDRERGEKKRSRKSGTGQRFSSTGARKRAVPRPPRLPPRPPAPAPPTRGGACGRIDAACLGAAADVANSLDHMLISPTGPASGGGDPKKGRAEG
jgi:hypothetical protein